VTGARIICVETASDLPGHWRHRASDLEAFAPAAAAAFREAAETLEATLMRAADELLNLEQAAVVSGFSADHLGRLVRDGRIPNRGRPNAPRVRRGDLPKKAGAVPLPIARSSSQFSVRRIAESVTTRTKRRA